MLLERLHIPFKVCHAPVDETPYPRENVSDLVQRLALAKARSAAAQYPDALIIGGDQSAYIKQSFLHKPYNFDDARQQLMQCSGEIVKFHSGICLLNAITDTYQLADVLTYVHFRQLNPREIERYLAQESVYGCAGSFRSERYGISLFELINSDDPSALQGLPLITLCHMLRAAGWRIP